MRREPKPKNTSSHRAYRDALPAGIVAPMSDSLLGQVLADRYELREQQAEEMLGRVYLATDKSTGSLVHVKVLHPYLTQNPVKVRRFAREVTATRAVAHPNSVAVIDAGESGDLHWLVLEYFPTRSLQDVVEKDGPLDPARAVHITAQIASALSVAHKEGIVHRNLNPGTILLLDNARRDDFVKVRDFGLSRLQADEEGEGEDDGAALTMAGARIGNTFYMAPEYIEEQLVDPRGDIYALGCILTFMLTGRPPFTGRPAQVLDKHINERPTPVSRERSDLPPWLDDYIMRLLVKNPRQRPTADAVHEVLESKSGKALNAPPMLAVGADGKAIPPGPIERLLDNKMLLASIGAGILLVAGVATTGLAIGMWYFSG